MATLTQLTWQAGVSPSALHAAHLVILEKKLVDPALLAALAQPATSFQAELAHAGIDPPTFWRHLIPLAAQYENNRELALATLIRLRGRSPSTEALALSLAGLLSDIETAFHQVLPKLREELPLRIGPLREQWESRGPGMLRTIGQLTDEALIPEGATIVVLHPAAGGAGEAYLPHNQVHIEGLLANPQPELPEIVRLAWLLSQVQLELPRFSETVEPIRLIKLAPLAMLPVALAAAEEVELVRSAASLLSTAITWWQLAPHTEAETSLLLAQWWGEYQDSRPPWPIALAALDQMLPANYSP